VTVQPLPLPASTIAVLVATRDRPTLLHRRALPSIARQSRPPDAVVLVNDGRAWTASEEGALRAAVPACHVALLENRRSPGAAGAWNTGLAWIDAHHPASFVAMLDDDDTWEPEHLALNARMACERQADAVVSGLRMLVDGHAIARPLIERLDEGDFLTGNPGWQGSNTFMARRALAAIGDFREDLASCHDRDLALRALRHAGLRIELLPAWTASWHLDSVTSLSRRLSPAKLAGLRTFYGAYGPSMTPAQRAAFFRRAESFFGFTAGQILGEALPAAPAPYGGGPSRA
jgi:GT2 family glycosyltransferase